jgi:chromosome segregation ATPase
MQTELQLRDLEVHKLAAAAAAARKERDEQKLRADKLEAIANLSRGSPGNGVMKSSSSPYGAAVPFYHSPQRQHVAPSPPARISPATTTSPAQPPSNEAQIAVSELRVEAETLRQQVEMAASELQAQRARADAAEERARYAEARAGADSAAHNANESELRTLKQKLHSMENEVKRLATDLAIAEDRAGLAEASLAEGRSNNTTNSASRGINNSAALTEVALTAQIRALATQLKVAKTEAATAQQELARFKAETQGHAAVHEGTTASILSANRELEAALAHASQNLEIRGEELEQARGAVARLAAENAALHAALKDRDEQYAALEYRMNNNSNSEGTLRANAAEKQLVAAQQELKIAKTRIADLEHAISKNSHTKGFSSSASTGPSPLRDIVGSLRAELEDRELRLAAAEEELATERRRAGDLHRQVLDQAVEIDDLHRETHTGDDILRKELEQARKEAHSAALELAEVRQQQESKEASRAGAIRTAEVELIKQLREELDARESEVMELQGQLHTLVAMNNGGGRGGVPGGGGAGEVENWLMGP